MAEHSDPSEDRPEERAPQPGEGRRGEQGAAERRRGRWLAAALVGAAAPGAVAGTASAAAPAAAPAQVSAQVAAQAPAAAPAGGTVVTVRRGDTVGHIAARTGSTVRAIVEANGLDARARVREGQELRVPAPGASADAGASAAPAEITVRAGDTLGALAATHGTTVGALREANGLDARGFIREGQVLRLAGAPAAAPPADQAGESAGGRYTVRAGDTLGAIAAAHGTSVAALVRANDLTADGFIREGQVLDLGPGAQAPAPSPSSSAGSSAAPADGTTRAGTIAGAVAQNQARLASADLPGREEMREIVRSTAVRLGVDPALALAISYQESGFNMRVVSHANAIGAMQVIPSSGEWASNLLGENLDLFDPHDNAKAGVVILRTLTARNDLDVAIASYYQGEAGVRSRGMYDDTRRYVANVRTLMSRFG
ncbi:LysM peptidoglycan-binding domain-containing protein [Kineococcus terrestris]|uniref:LysM peptidoglycan-binding domain-containing protein n=1 Tax=Kineococcus terrestris TaxID=2044856 RepID=UPI0034DB179C